MQTGKRANGGVESITQVIERLRRFRPIIVTQLETPVVQRWRDAGAEVHIWELPYGMHSSAGSPLQRLRRASVLARMNGRMLRLVRQTGARVVHCNDIFGWLHCAFGARMAGARVVHNVRDTKPDGRYRFHWRLAHQLSGVTLVLSEEMAEQLAAGMGVSRQRIHAIYSVVDPEKYRSLVGAEREAEREAERAALGIPPGTLAIGNIGVVCPKKGQLNFLRETLKFWREAICESSLPLHLYFIGDCDPATDEYARACVEAVAQHGLAEYVHFVGYSGEVFRWYRSLDVTALASEYEGLARAMIESLACGTPVVSTEVCSAREILEGHECGFVAARGDYATLWRGIEKLARNAEMRSLFGRRGIEAAHRLFDPERVVAQYEETYLALQAG